MFTIERATMTYAPSTYGDEIADVYDALHGDADPRAVTTLAELANHGPVLELGIGTGRLALPLVRRGLSVHGVDASAAMVEKLRSKPDGVNVPVTIGDFGQVTLDEQFSLIFVAFNTFFGNAGVTHERAPHIRAAVRRAVRRRDGGQCSFVGDEGRCAERGFLEFHHLKPHALGGEATVSGICPRRRAHDIYEANWSSASGSLLMRCAGYGCGTECRRGLLPQDATGT